MRPRQETRAGGLHALVSPDRTPRASRKKSREQEKRLPSPAFAPTGTRTRLRACEVQAPAHVVRVGPVDVGETHVGEHEREHHVWHVPAHPKQRHTGRPARAQHGSKVRRGIPREIPGPRTARARMRTIPRIRVRTLDEMSGPWHPGSVKGECKLRPTSVASTTACSAHHDIIGGRREGRGGEGKGGYGVPGRPPKCLRESPHAEKRRVGRY